jgi:O-acetyl-ADP-ribose deacetylase (regulator of RNase III)
MKASAVITEASGNLLTADADALVNTVNTVGVMGKGIALQFKRAYPEMFKDYARAAKAGEVRLGEMHIWPTGLMTGPRYIINFPTKGHWKSSSKLADVECGLDDLVNVIRRLEIQSIAVPPLGCGHGGLDWNVVGPLIRRRLAEVPDVDVQLFAPAGAPAAAEMKSAGPAPKMTPGRAALVELMARYSQFASSDPSLIEIQKLMYFLQVAGEPLRLSFVPHHYGPYADGLRHVLAELEGHLISGFGDGSAPVEKAEPLVLLPDARDAAQERLTSSDATDNRMQRVLGLIEGFESAYALELLATTHWVVTHSSGDAEDDEDVVHAVRGWSKRKDRLFAPDHIRTALRVLRERGWAPELEAVG